MIVGVAGANGFIGRSLCQKYLDKGDKVYALLNESHSLIPNGCIIFNIENFPKIRIDFLFITIGGHGLNHQDYLSQNLYIDRLIKELTFDKIIFISSVEVYGKHENLIKINSCFNQPNLYGLSKISQEFLIRSCQRFTIIRPTYTYGPGMRNNSLIPTWKNAAAKTKEIVVFGNGERKQDYLYIDDLISLCYLITTSENSNRNDTVIVASGKAISNLDLAKEIGSYYQTTIKKIGNDNSPSSEFDISETIKLYNWKPSIFIEDGLKKYLNSESSYLQ